MSANVRKARRWRLRVWFVGVELRLGWQDGDTAVTRDGSGHPTPQRGSAKVLI